MKVPEVDLRFGGSWIGSELCDWPTITTWTVPADMVAERGLRVEDLVVVRSPTAVPGDWIKVGDRLLVDVGEAARQATKGVSVIWDGRGHVLARVRRSHGGRLYLEGYRGTIEIPVGDVGVCGRVVGRWGWM